MRTVHVVRVEPTSRAAAIAISTALAAACDKPAQSVESPHTISTVAPTALAQAIADSGADASRSFSVTAEGSADAGPEQTLAVLADATAFDAAIAALATPATTNANDNAAANDPFAGLGITGWGAAYGASPNSPGTRDIGRGPVANVSVQFVAPPDPRLRAMLSVRRGLLAMCYQRELMTNPAAFGSMEVQFDIRPDGTTTGVAVRSSSLSASLVECVRGRFNAYRVPPALAALGHVTVRYVFNNRR